MNRTAAHGAPRQQRWRPLVLTGVAVSLGVAVLLSLSLGQLAASPTEVAVSLARLVGLNAGAVDPTVQATLLGIRLPRVLFAVLVGAALGLSGMMMQAIFANPLAEPAIIGVSSGAALGASAFLAFGGVFGASLAADLGTAASGFVAGLATTFLVYTIARHRGRTEVVTLVLTGIAINAFAAGGLALLLFLADSATREQLVFWQLGSLNGASWSDVAIVAPLVALGLLAALRFARSYDTLALGERSAKHLGVRVERVRTLSIIAIAVLASAAVAFAGIIAFVGLIVPHLMRLALGPSHRMLAWASVLGGALLLSIADLIARTMVPFADLPIGMLTSLVGGPFFLWLLLRTRRKQGGFA